MNFFNIQNAYNMKIIRGWDTIFWAIDFHSTICEGKYEFYMQNDSLYCRRYGEEWRQFVGDNAVRALFDLALELQTENETLQLNIYDGCD